METAATSIMCPFTIVTDTREQLPYTFTDIRADAGQLPRTWAADNPPGTPRPLVTVPTVRYTLRQGDYSVMGMEDSIAVERKVPIDRLPPDFVRQRVETLLDRDAVFAAWKRDEALPAGIRVEVGQHLRIN